MDSQTIKQQASKRFSGIGYREIKEAKYLVLEGHSYYDRSQQNKDTKLLTKTYFFPKG